MRTRVILVLLPVLSLVACASSPALGGWTPLGERTVTPRVERDEIAVGARSGSFDRIKLTVRGRGRGPIAGPLEGVMDYGER